MLHIDHVNTVQIVLVAALNGIHKSVCVFFRKYSNIHRCQKLQSFKVHVLTVFGLKSIINKNCILSTLVIGKPFSVNNMNVLPT